MGGGDGRLCGASTRIDLTSFSIEELQETDGERLLIQWKGASAHLYLRSTYLRIALSRCESSATITDGICSNICSNTGRDSR